MPDQPRVTKVFGHDPEGHCAIALLAVFFRRRYDIGVTEEQLTKESGFGNDALYGLSKLEQEGFVRSLIVQVGTAGPFARYYKLVDGIGLRLELSKPA